MATDRYKIIREAAQEQGKTRLEIFNAVAPSWNLSPIEHARMENAIRSTSEPPTKGQRDAAAVVEASRAEAAKQQTETDRRAALAYRNAPSPLHAAHIMAANQHAVVRGLRALRTPPPDDEPPPSAA